MDTRIFPLFLHTFLHFFTLVILSNDRNFYNKTIFIYLKDKVVIYLEDYEIILKSLPRRQILKFHSDHQVLYCAVCGHQYYERETEYNSPVFKLGSNESKRQISGSSDVRSTLGRRRYLSSL